MAKQITEYAVRTIDEFGDVVDVNHYGSFAEAFSEANHSFNHLEENEKAVVVEKEVLKWRGSGDPEFDDADEHNFEVVLTIGSVEALSAGRWDQ